MPSAASITIEETLSLLDNQFAEVSAGVAQGSYAFWLGSGISRERVVGLDGVLKKLLDFLQGRVTNDPTCPYRGALEKIVALAAPSADERAMIDFSKPVANWGCLGDLLKRLWNQYSTVLSVEFPGEKLDYLLWVGLDFPNTFAAEQADAEHLAIAMLALEGAVTDLASANWDGLLEAALVELGHNQNFYRITVTGQDLRGSAAAARLYKFHGCALRAIENEAQYRPLLIARSPQIISWSADAKFKIVRDQLSALAQTKRTLMIGLSAQDANIKHLFATVNQQAGWKWEDAPQPFVFSADELGDDHRNVLSVAYGEEHYEANRAAICEAARLRAYAKPLLLSLLLQVLTRKLEVLALDADAPNLSVAERDKISDGIRALRDRVAVAGNSDRLHLARSIAQGLARARHQLQNGSSDIGPQAYFPIDNQPEHLMRGNAALKSSGQREAAVALGLIGLEETEAAWSSSVGDPASPQTGALQLSTENASARVFLAANDSIITGLLECGAFEETDADAVVICSGRVTSRQQRSPSGNWRSGNVGPRYVALGSILREATNLDDLRDRFRGDIGL